MTDARTLFARWAELAPSEAEVAEAGRTLWLNPLSGRTAARVAVSGRYGVDLATWDDPHNGDETQRWTVEGHARACLIAAGYSVETHAHDAPTGPYAWAQCWQSRDDVSAWRSATSLAVALVALRIATLDPRLPRQSSQYDAPELYA